MGVVVPLAWLTVAVSVTGEFCVTVEAEACNVVEVLTTADFTVTETVPDEEALKLVAPEYAAVMELDRKSTRLNSSHVSQSRMPSSA